MMILEVVVGIAIGAVLVSLVAALVGWRIGDRPIRWLYRGGAAGSVLGFVIGASYGRLGVSAVLGGGLASAGAWLLVALVLGALWWNAVERESGSRRRTSLGLLVYVLLCVLLVLLAIPFLLVGFLVAFLESLIVQG